jgi:glutaredoxin
MKKVIIVVAVIIALFGLYKLFSHNPAVSGVSDNTADLILFWGQGCPHCEKVKQYIADNKLDAKIKIAYHEIYYNKDNQQLLADTVKGCPEIDISQGIGVPLAFDKKNNKCLSGDEPIIQWLSQK